MKKLQHGLLLFLLAILLCGTVQVTNSTTSQADKVKKIHTRTKKQAKQAFNKAWRCYKKNIAFDIVSEYGKKDKTTGLIMITGHGEEKYEARANKAWNKLLKRIKKQSGLKWIPKPDTDSSSLLWKSDIVSYKRAIKYLKKITVQVNKKIESASVGNDHYKLSKVLEEYFET